MNSFKQKQITITVSKIINWPQPESTESKFELSFYSKSQGALIISKVVIGKYINESKTMYLKRMLKICYNSNEEMVILRVSHRMGLVGLIVLGEFDLNLTILSKKTQVKLCIDNTKNQYLIIEHGSGQSRSNKLICQQKNQIDLKRYEQYFKQENKRSSKTKQFIREKQEFLERHSSNSSRGNSRLSARDKLVGISKRDSQQQNKYISSQQYLNEFQEAIKDNIDFYPENNQYMTRNFSTERDLYQINRHQLLYTQKNVNRRSQQKLYIQNPQYFSSTNLQNKKDRSFNQSEKTNSSSQKYLLLVKNLNVIPCEQYYQSRVNSIVKQNSKVSNKNEKQKNKKIQTLNELKLDTNKKFKDFYSTESNLEHQISIRDIQTQAEKQKGSIIKKLQLQFKRRSEYY